MHAMYEQHTSASVLPPLSWQGLVQGLALWQIVRLIFLTFFLTLLLTLLDSLYSSSPLHRPSSGFQGGKKQMIIGTC